MIALPTSDNQNTLRLEGIHIINNIVEYGYGQTDALVEKGCIELMTELLFDHDEVVKISLRLLESLAEMATNYSDRILYSHCFSRCIQIVRKT